MKWRRIIVFTYIYIYTFHSWERHTIIIIKIIITQMYGHLQIVKGSRSSEQSQLLIISTLTIIIVTVNEYPITNTQNRTDHRHRHPSIPIIILSSPSSSDFMIDMSRSPIFFLVSAILYYYELLFFYYLFPSLPNKTSPKVIIRVLTND